MSIKRIGPVVVILMAGLATACAESRPGTTLNEGPLLVVVDYDLFHDIEASLELYAEGLRQRGLEVHVEPWAPEVVEDEIGAVTDLRELIFRYRDEEQIDGAVLVGQLPVAWYEQEAHDKHEEFPMDIYLQDRDAVWTDADEDGILDGHSPLELDIYTSRIDGSAEELREYFDRVDYYRNIGPLVEVRAFVFIDDPWAQRIDIQAEYLDQIYEDVLLMYEPADTSFGNYCDVMTGDGAEFVFQGSHSGITYLKIEHEGEDEYCTCGEVVDLAFRGSFFNLFNCSAARFTQEPNLAHAYLLGTGYGLAVVGSTKTGAIINSRVFHRRLSEGRTWGRAYLDWYNEVGVNKDEWHLGIVLMGDPLLHLYPRADALRQVSELSSSQPTSPEYGDIMREIARTADLGTFEEYREAHPHFFPQ